MMNGNFQKTSLKTVFESSTFLVENLERFNDRYSESKQKNVKIFIKLYPLSAHWRRKWQPTPLQYSFLENPVDRGAWWAAVYGVAQSRTQLQRLSSSSSQLKSVTEQRDLCTIPKKYLEHEVSELGVLRGNTLTESAYLVQAP